MTQRETISRYINEQADEISELKDMLHSAGHAFQDNWAIDWEPILDIMEKVDNDREKDKKSEDIGTKEV